MKAWLYTVLRFTIINDRVKRKRHTKLLANQLRSRVKAEEIIDVAKGNGLDVFRHHLNRSPRLNEFANRLFRSQVDGDDVGFPAALKTPQYERRLLQQLRATLRGRLSWLIDDSGKLLRFALVLPSDPEASGVLTEGDEVEITLQSFTLSPLFRIPVDCRLTSVVKSLDAFIESSYERKQEADLTIGEIKDRCHGVLVEFMKRNAALQYLTRDDRIRMGRRFVDRLATFYKSEWTREFASEWRGQQGHSEDKSKLFHEQGAEVDVSWFSPIWKIRSFELASIG